jgi:hypothetical protein
VFSVEACPAYHMVLRAKQEADELRRANRDVKLLEKALTVPTPEETQRLYRYTQKWLESARKHPQGCSAKQFEAHLLLLLLIAIPTARKEIFTLLREKHVRKVNSGVASHAFVVLEAVGKNQRPIYLPIPEKTVWPLLRVYLKYFRPQLVKGNLETAPLFPGATRLSALIKPISQKVLGRPVTAHLWRSAMVQLVQEADATGNTMSHLARAMNHSVSVQQKHYFNANLVKGGDQLMRFARARERERERGC